MALVNLGLSIRLPFLKSANYNINKYGDQQYYKSYNLHVQQALGDESSLNCLLNESANNPYLNDVTYLPSAFIHVSFMQHNICNSATDCSYSNTALIGSNSLTIQFTGKYLPYGIYPRRLLAYLSKLVIRTRAKSPIIKISGNKLQFYKDALGIKYTPSNKDVQAIDNQVRAFVTCYFSISYSNPNEGGRKPREQIQFMDGDHSWLYDDSQEWQPNIKLSPDMLELIKLTAVPVSAKAMAEFTNARTLDIFNYLLYQNYNLYIKGLDARLNIADLYNQFGSGINDVNEFRRVLNRINLQIKDLVPIDINVLNRHIYLINSSAECLLIQHKRKPTNIVNDPLTAINEDYKNKLKQNKSELNVEAACVYLAKRIKTGHVRNPHAYLRDVLRNPSWYRRELEDMVKVVHKLQYQEYLNIAEEQRKINAKFFKDLISKSHIFSLPPELRPLLEQFRQPGRKIIEGMPNFDYCCYIVWAYMHKRCTEFIDSPEILIVNYLNIVCK